MKVETDFDDGITATLSNGTKLELPSLHSPQGAVVKALVDLAGNLDTRLAVIEKQWQQLR